MLIIEYTKEGKAISDFKIEDFIEQLEQLQQQGKYKEYKISTELVFLAIRAAIKTGQLDFNNIKFTYGMGMININKDGRMDYTPRGFCDNMDNYLEALIDWGTPNDI